MSPLRTSVNAGPVWHVAHRASFRKSCLPRAAAAASKLPAGAEDVMQQAYVNAFANLRQFNRQAQFSTWLTRIVVNESLARVRRKQRYEPFEEERSNVEAFMKWDSPRDPEREAASGDAREPH